MADETLGQTIASEIDSREDQVSRQGGQGISLEDFFTAAQDDVQGEQRKPNEEEQFEHTQVEVPNQNYLNEETEITQETAQQLDQVVSDNGLLQANNRDVLIEQNIQLDAPNFQNTVEVVEEEEVQQNTTNTNVTSRGNEDAQEVVAPVETLGDGVNNVPTITLGGVIGGSTADGGTTGSLTLNVDEDTPASIRFTTEDIDGDTVTTDAVAEHGTIVIENGQITYTPDENYNGSDTIVVVIDDGNGGVVTEVIAVTVNPINDEPTIEMISKSVVDEDGSKVISFVTDDVDGDTVTTSAVASNGTVVVENGQIIYTPDVNFNGADTIIVTIDDGNGGVVTKTIDMTVNPVNDVPTISVISQTVVDEDGSKIISFTTDDIDGDTVTTDAVASNGTVVVENGQIIYTPNENYNGSDTITVTIDDGNGGVVTKTIDVTVNPVNDAPEITIETVNNFVEDSGVAVGDVVATFSTNDEDGDSVNVTLSDTVNYALDGNSVVLTEAGLALVNQGIDLPAFTLTPNDGTVDGESVSADPSVESVNDGLTTFEMNDVAAFVEDATNAGDVVTTVKTAPTDEDGGDITYSISDTINYAIDATTGEVTLTQTGADYVNAGNDLPAFDVTASSSNSSLTVEDLDPSVSLVDDATVLTITNGTAVEDTTTAGTVMATFSTSDEDSTVTVDFTSGTNDAGYYEIDGNNVVLTTIGEAYLDAGNELPNISLTTNTNVTETNTVTTTLVNDAPELTITNVNNFVEDSGVAVGDVVATFSTNDEDGDSVNVTLSDTVNYALDGNSVVLTEAGLALVNQGVDLPAFTLTPNDGTVDGESVSADPSVESVNDGLTTFEMNDVATFVEDATNAGDVVTTVKTAPTDEDGGDITYSISGNENGYYAIDTTTGEVTLTQTGADYVNAGNDLPAFDVTASSSNSSLTVEDLDPSVSLVDDATVLTITNGTAIEDTTTAGTVMATFSTSDEDSTVTVDFTDGTNDAGYYEIDGNNVVLTTIGEAYLDAGNELPNISLTTNTDVTETNTVTTTLVNDAPTIEAETRDVQEDQVVRGTIQTADEDGTVTVAISEDAIAPEGLKVFSNGYYTFDAKSYDSLAQGETQVLNVPITVTDNDGATANSVLTITITGTNDAPTATAEVTNVLEDSVVTGQINMDDIDGTVTVDIREGDIAPEGLTLNSDGTYEFDASSYDSLKEGQEDQILVPLTVTDDKGETINTSLTITITGTNDTPVVNSVDLGSIDDVETINFKQSDLIANASDLDGDSLSVTSVSVDAQYGTITQNTDGTYTFTPVAGFSGDDLPINFTVTDGIESQSAIATLDVVDTTAPDISKLAITNIVDNDGDYTSVTMYGTGAEVGNTITLYDESNNAVATTEVQEDGTWSIQIENLSGTPINDNEFFKVTETDDAGNETAKTDSTHYWHGDWSNGNTESTDDYVMTGAGDDTINTDDTLTGTNENSTVTSDNNDTNDYLVIDGGDGDDTVTFGKAISEYTITENENGEIVVTENSSSDSDGDGIGDVTVLRNIETFTFANEEYTKEDVLDTVASAPTLQMNIGDANTIVVPGVVDVVANTAAGIYQNDLGDYVQLQNVDVDYTRDVVDTDAMETAGWSLGDQGDWTKDIASNVSDTTEYNLNQNGDTATYNINTSSDISIGIKSFKTGFDDGEIKLTYTDDQGVKQTTTINIDDVYTGNNGEDTITIQNTLNVTKVEVSHTGLAQGNGSNSGEFKIQGVSSTASQTQTASDNDIIMKTETYTVTEQQEVDVDPIMTDDTTTYEYQITLDAALTDTDGSETLSDITMDNLPNNITVQDSDGNNITANSDGSYTVSIDNNGDASVILVSDTEISQEDLNSITSSVTATESNSGDTNTTIDTNMSDYTQDVDGEDDNTYTVNYDNIELDFDNINATNVETLDLGLGDNTNINLTNLDISDVLSMTDDNELTILGDEGDTVSLDTNTWTQGEDFTDESGNIFSTFTGGGENGLQEVQLLIDSHVEVTQG